MFRQFLAIFRQWQYSGLAGLVAWIMFSLVMWLPNLSLIMTIWHSNQTLVNKLAVLWSLYGGLFTNHTLLTAGYVVLIALLFGVQVALLAYYIHIRRVSGGQVWRLQFSGLSGLVASALGIGCAACGSLVLTTLLASFGGATLLVLLPLHGAEFGVLGVLLLGYTCYRLLRNIMTPPVCEVEYD